MRPRVLLVIPAYNEAGNIVNVVDNIVQNYQQYDYVVVNDGSVDETPSLCAGEGYNCINYCANLGIAGAFYGGMRYAHVNGYDYAVQFDGDGQHNAEYIQRMLEVLAQKQCDIVIGSRFLSGNKPWSLRLVGNRMIAICFFLATGKKIADPTSGMRLYNRRMIQYFAEHVEMMPEPDAIAGAMHGMNVNIAECHVTMNQRIHGASSMTVSAGILYVIRVCLALLLTTWLKRVGRRK